MKYTKRVDGLERATHIMRMHLTREELKDRNARARKMGYKDYRQYVQYQVGAAMVSFEEEWEDFVKYEGEA